LNGESTILPLLKFKNRLDQLREFFYASKMRAIDSPPIKAPKQLVLR
jgi:hypothetical protein